MGSDLILSGAVSLLRLLSKAPDHAMSTQKICDALLMSDDALASVVSDINSMDFVVRENGQSLQLLRSLDFIDAEDIFKKVHGRGRVELLDSIGSTNTVMLASAHNSVSGDVLIAEIQTAGRGRRENRWQSGICNGVTMSMTWRFPLFFDISTLAVAIGCSVAEAIESEFSKKIMIKWPNDLIADGFKLGGILIETERDDKDLAVVIGIGINVYKVANNQAFISPQPHQGLRNAVSATVINALRDCCRTYEKSGYTLFSRRVEQRDFLKGRQITVEDGGRELSGQAKGINQEGTLVITSGGKDIAIRSGHISSF